MGEAQDDNAYTAQPYIDQSRKYNTQQQEANNANTRPKYEEA